MRYVNSSLADGEHVVFGPIPLTGWEYFPLAVLLVPIPFIWLRRWTTEYAITNFRLVTKQGLIARVTDELRLEAIESVQVRQGLLGRLFNFGTLVATGRGNQVIRMENICAPLDAKKCMESVRN